MLFVKTRKNCRIHDVVVRSLAGVTFVFAIRVAVSSLHGLNSTTSYEAASGGAAPGHPQDTSEVRTSPSPSSIPARN